MWAPQLQLREIEPFSCNRKPDYCSNVPKKTGIAVSFVLTGGLAARWMEEGQVDLWMLMFSAFLAYWLGFGLGVVIQEVRANREGLQKVGEGPQGFAVGEAGTKPSTQRRAEETPPSAHQPPPPESQPKSFQTSADYVPTGYVPPEVRLKNRVSDAVRIGKSAKDDLMSRFAASRTEPPQSPHNNVEMWGPMNDQSTKDEQTTTANEDWMDQLRRLGSLRDDGLLTQAEFDAEKARLLEEKNTE